MNNPPSRDHIMKNRSHIVFIFLVRNKFSTMYALVFRRFYPGIPSSIEICNKLIVAISWKLESINCIFLYVTSRLKLKQFMWNPIEPIEIIVNLLWQIIISCNVTANYLLRNDTFTTTPRGIVCNSCNQSCFYLLIYKN